MNPYDRERKIMPIAIQATRTGVRMDRELLKQYSVDYNAAIEFARERVFDRLDQRFLLTSGKQLAAALDAAGAVTEQVFTAKGNRSTAREVLENTISDPELRDDIIYFNTIRKSLSDFIEKWLVLSAADGRVHPNWNQVRSRDNFGGGKGARTGRFSCDNPNLQNPPNEYHINIPEGLPEPPVLRRAFLPEEGHTWLMRDFSGQEIRVAAHFEDGTLLQAYIDDPALDPHEMARELIKEITGLDFPRKHVKITAFQIMYGGGPKAISQGVGTTWDNAVRLIDGYLRAIPGFKWLQKDTRQLGRSGSCITTWGGRKYYVEPSEVIKGRKMDFSYKLLNYLIQGSAADQTKQCIIDWHHEYRQPGDVFLATVHDEINISAPEEHWEESMLNLRNAMDQDLFDCPMRSEGKAGPNWADIKDVD